MSAGPWAVQWKVRGQLRAELRRLLQERVGPCCSCGENETTNQQSKGEAWKLKEACRFSVVQIGVLCGEGR